MAKYRQRVQTGIKPNGEPVLQWVQGNSQSELQANMIAACVKSGWINNFLPDKQPRIKAPTFGEYAQEWLKLYKDGSRKINTIKTYEKWFKAHIYPALGKKPLTEFR